MTAIVIVGAQWGDEGKGKITDYLAEKAAAVVRYQGGNNAGHTLVLGEEVYKLHLIPSGILHREKDCVLGNGVVLDLPALVRELDQLIARGVDVSNLHISEAAHLIFSHHIDLDRFSENKAKEQSIGTTQRGIGPAYLDKVNRHGVRLGVLASPETFRDMYLRQRVLAHVITGTHFSSEDADREIEAQLAAHSRLKPYIKDTGHFIEGLLNQNKNVLFEGAQGTFLDLDHGTYPYVTSSTPTAGGACVGSGIGPTRISKVIGVTKAYTTRVGEGPFPTELSDDLGLMLRAEGQEFGTTTGRPRRCGWLDLVMIKYATRINGLTSLAITKLDVLDQLDEIKICIAYEIDGEQTSQYPTNIETLKRAKPVYKTFHGWKSSTKNIKKNELFPMEVQSYLNYIADAVGVEVSMVSVGADRHSTIVQSDLW